MRTTQKEVKERYKEIARKHNLELKDIIDIESSIWKMITDKIAEGKREDFESFHNIYVAGLGTFYASEGMWRHTNKNREKRDD